MQKCGTQMNHDPTAIAAEVRAGDTSASPSLSSAFERVLTASQRVITDRIDLVRLESAATISHAIRGGALLGVGGILICGGWFAAMGIVVVLLDAYVTLTAGLAVVALLSLAAGGSFVVLGLQRLLPPVTAQRINAARHE